MKKFEKLSRAEMKNVTGGVADPGTCAYSCDGFYSPQSFSKATAQAQADENVTSGRCQSATWCCSSCP